MTLINRSDLEVTVNKCGHTAFVTINGYNAFEQVVRDTDDRDIHCTAFPSSNLGRAAHDANALRDYASAMLGGILREQGLL